MYTEFEIANADASGTPLLCIHGVGSSLREWRQVVAALPSDRPVVTYDLRGHGKSDKPAGPYELEHFIGDALALMDDLGFDEFDVVGFSLGGIIAQGLALDASGRVRRLVVIGSVANRSPEEKERALKRLHEVETEGPLAVAERSVDRWFTPEYIAEHPEVRQRTLQAMAALDPAAYAAAYRVLATSDLKDRLHAIEAPTLAIAGAGDVGSPPHMSEYIARTVKNGRLVVIEGVKHDMLNLVTETIAKEISTHVTA